MKKISLAILLSGFLAAPVLAAEPYIGVSVGQNDIDILGVDKSNAFALFGGYSYNENIAAELAYTDFGSADIAGSSLKLDGYAISLAAVGSLPLNKDFSLFAKLGVASTKIKNGASESKSDLVYGIGAQFNASKNVGVRVGYDVYQVGDTTTVDSNLLSISALYKY